MQLDALRCAYVPPTVEQRGLSGQLLGSYLTPMTLFSDKLLRLFHSINKDGYHKDFLVLFLNFSPRELSFLMDHLDCLVDPLHMDPSDCFNTLRVFRIMAVLRENQELASIRCLVVSKVASFLSADDYDDLNSMRTSLVHHLLLSRIANKDHELVLDALNPSKKIQQHLLQMVNHVDPNQLFRIVMRLLKSQPSSHKGIIGGKMKIVMDAMPSASTLFPITGSVTGSMKAKERVLASASASASAQLNSTQLNI